MSFLIGDDKLFSQVIAENLNTAVVSDINTLAKSIRDDRRKVSSSDQQSFATIKFGQFSWTVTH